MNEELEEEFIWENEMKELKNKAALRDEARAIYEYAIDNGRILKEERIVMQEPEFAYYYAKDVIGGRWPEAEKFILDDVRYAHRYAIDVIRGRWPEFEQMWIDKLEPCVVLQYCKDAAKGRLIEFEDNFKFDPYFSNHYAVNIVKGRWIKGEGCILQDMEVSIIYAKDVVQKRWPELEQKLIESKNSRLILKYCKSLNQRIPEMEPLLNHFQLIQYCNYFSIPLPEENYNRELLECAIKSKKSNYLDKIKKEKQQVVNLLKSLIGKGVIEENQTVKELIK